MAQSVVIDTSTLINFLRIGRVDLERHMAAGVIGLDGLSEQSVKCERLVIAACLAAFIGSFAGVRLVRKVTLRGLKVTVGVMLLLMAAALAAGVV